MLDILVPVVLVLAGSATGVWWGRLDRDAGRQADKEQVAHLAGKVVQLEQKLSAANEAGSKLDSRRAAYQEQVAVLEDRIAEAQRALSGERDF